MIRPAIQDYLEEFDYEEFFANAAVGIAVVNAEGKPIVTNHELQSMLGYTAEEFRDLPFTAFTHPDDQDLDWTLYRELLAGAREQYEMDKRYCRKDGKTTPPRSHRGPFERWRRGLFPGRFA